MRWSLATRRPSLPVEEVLAPRAPAPAMSMLALAFTVVIVMGAFFAIDHDYHTSVHEAYTSTAAEFEKMVTGGNLLRRFAFFGIAGVGLLFLAVSPHARWSPGLLSNCIAITALWAASTWLWSIDPEMTQRRLIVLGCVLIGAYGIGRSFSPRDLCRLGVAAGLASLAVGLFAEFSLGSFKPWSGEYRFAGTLHPNTQAMYLAVLTLSSFCLARSGEAGSSKYWLTFLLALGFLVLTRSRTATAAALLGVAAAGTLQASWSSRIAVILGTVFIGALILLGVLASGVDLQREMQQAVLLGREEQSESLTGRLPIWMEVSDHIATRPFQGHGYDTFWTPDNIDIVSTRVQWGLRESHNAYLELTLSLGLVGLGLVLSCVLLGIVRAVAQFQATGDAAYGLMAGLFIFGLSNGLLESGMIFPQWPAFIALCGLMHLTRSGAE